MSRIEGAARSHIELTRRYFLRLGAAGAAGVALSPLWARGAERDAALAVLIRELEYLTPPLEFQSVERGDPLPYTLPLEKRRDVGLERETWKLEVIPDSTTAAEVENPLSRERGTALTFDGLMEMAKTKAVRKARTLADALRHGSLGGAGGSALPRQVRHPLPDHRSSAGSRSRCRGRSASPAATRSRR